MNKDTYILRPLEPNDVDLLYVVENDPEQWPVSNTTVPYSRHLLQEYILSTTGDIYTDKQLRLVVSDTKGTPLGLIDLQDFDAKNMKAELGMTILPEHRNKGIAVCALNKLLEYALQTLHLHQLYAIIPEHNQPSQAMVQKCGFTRTSVLKDWLYNGKEYQNAILFQRFL